MSPTDLSDHRTTGDAQTGVVELVRQLSDDSRRLARGEIRLAKLEMADALRTGGQGAMILGIAFGAGVVALSALTICVIAALSLAVGKVWIAALATGVVEIGLGFLLVDRGGRDFASLSHSMTDASPRSHHTTRARTSGRAD